LNRYQHEQYQSFVRLLDDLLGKENWQNLSIPEINWGQGFTSNWLVAQLVKRMAVLLAWYELKP
jgi:hypothetical protein